MPFWKSTISKIRKNVDSQLCQNPLVSGTNTRVTRHAYDASTALSSWVRANATCSLSSLLVLQRNLLRIFLPLVVRRGVWYCSLDIISNIKNLKMNEKNMIFIQLRSPCVLWFDNEIGFHCLLKKWKKNMYLYKFQLFWFCSG